MTAPRTTPDSDSLPPLHRPLSYDEWQQAQTLSPAALTTKGTFPVLPPVPAPARESTRVGAPDPNPQSQSLGHAILQGAADLGVTGVGMLSAPLTALQRAIAPSIGEARADPRLSKGGNSSGRPIETAPYDAEHGGVTTGERVLAGAQATAPFLAGPVGGKLADALTPALGDAGASAVSKKLVDAGIGAVYNPSNPAQGAVFGAGAGSVARENAPAVKAQIGETIEQVKAEIQKVNDAWDTMHEFHDQMVQTKGIFRAQTGDMAQRYEQAAHTLDQFRRIIDPLSDQEKLHFIDAIEGGKSQPTAEFQQLADAIRKSLDDTRDSIRSLGTGKLEHFITDYFPHIWDDEDAAGKVFAQIFNKSPLEGQASFLRERTIPTTAEGMAMGLKPITTNPIDLTLLKLREMQRYLMAHGAVNQLHDAGITQFVRAGELAPDGYARIEDKIARVLGPKYGAVGLPDDANVKPEDVQVYGHRVMGEYWAPEPVANTINNYLSPGFQGAIQKMFPGAGGKLGAVGFDLYKGLGNLMNQAQLGLSAFHLGFTSMDASVSRIALGMEYLKSSQPIEAAKKFISAPLAPLPGIAQGLIGDPINALTKRFTNSPTDIQWGLGAKIRAAYLDPKNASPEMRQLAQAVTQAGGRIRMDSFYQNSAPQRMIEAWKDGISAFQEGRPIAGAGNLTKSGLWLLPSMFEMAAKPIMEHIVPLQKLGIFGDLAKKAFADLPEGAPLSMRRQALQSAWDSVDNRMGQLVYDNLFWHKAFKDVAMASVRSVGWNLGTIRELGGGSVDLAKMAKDFASGNDTELTHRAAYVMALPITVGLYGALYQYLRTGHGPSEAKDYFYPKTGDTDADGNPERVQLASYMKDMFAYYQHPWQTLKNKQAPLLSDVSQMLNNQDYFGDEIRNPNDPIVRQLQQEVSYMFGQFEPFGIRNMSEQAKRGDSFGTRMGNELGITPAPRDQVRSDAENKIASDLAERRETGATPEDVEARHDRSELLAQLRAGKQGKLSAEDLSSAIERSGLPPADVVKLLKRAGTTPAVENFRRLTLAQQIDVYKTAMKDAKPAQLEKFKEILLKKIERQQAQGRATAAELTP